MFPSLKNTTMQRRIFVRNLLALAGAASLVTDLQAQKTPPRVEVWKDPSCGCCEDWVSHLRANGFTVQVHNSGNTAARTRLGVPDALGSCHTAQVGGYALEGHVPATDIHRLLKERPSAIGLTVPGMPIGSPGMDGAVYGGRRDAYDVLLIQRGGATRVYQHYPRA